MNAAAGRRLASFIRWDWANQSRQNMIAATALSTAALCAVALLAPQRPLPPQIAALLILIDPAAVGLGFVGAAAFLERSSGVLHAIGAAPTPLSVYLASKTVVFAAIGSVSGLIVAAAATDLWAQTGFGAPLVMALALIATNVCATLFGLGLACGAPSMNAFLLRAGVVSLPLALPPLFLLAGGIQALSPALWAIPSAPMAYLFAVGAGAEGGVAGLALSALLLIFWTALAWRFARRGLARLLRGGGA